MKKRPKSARTAKKPKNLFSEDTARFLLGLIKGKPKDLPETVSLPGNTTTGPNHEPSEQAGPDPQEELAAAIRSKLLPWIWSLFIHSTFLIALALTFMPARTNQHWDIILGIGDEEATLVRDILGRDAESDMTILTPQELPPVEFPLPELPEIETDEFGKPVAIAETFQKRTVISYQGRDHGSRAAMLGKGGGNGQSDQAVLAGLRWLVGAQMRDGSWHLCGPYRNGAPRNKENRNAATAMALLAFQGYGVTPSTSHPELIDFAKTVRSGWSWLLRQQSPDGCFFREGVAPSNDRFYTHGLCTIALCELLAMTGDDTFRDPAQRAIDYCVRHQSVEGGWRYLADRWTSGSDVSVTGWIVMALKSGEAAGLEIPRQTFENITTFLDGMARDSGSQYVYREERGATIRKSMTAEALLCRELLGWRRNDPRLERGVWILVEPEHLPTFSDRSKRDAYYWYYATQALHHFGGEPWRLWNERMREELVRYQEQKGSEAGSWHPSLPVEDEWGHSYGRLYTTCLSIYILEVYYRHLRVYQD